MKVGHQKKDIKTKEGTPPSQQEKKTFFGSILHELRKRKIIETLVAFIGGGWLIIEFVHWILVDHYHFPEKSIDITFISLLGALISTIIWRLFRESEKKDRKFKWELILIPLVVLATLLLDVSLLMKPDKHIGEHTHKTKWDNSIAVLPFADLSPTRDQGYLGDGMTDAIISKLSKLSELKVVSRTSVLQYKMKDKDVKVIGEELNVRTILEGTVQKVEDRVRIRAQLINAEDGFHLWSDTFDQEIKNIFTLQDNISYAIVDALKIEMGTEQSALFDKHSTNNIDAYTLYLKGRSYWNERTAINLRQGINYFELAIEKDPEYALAYSGIADSYIALANLGALSPYEAYPLARDWARRALNIDNSLAEAHASIAIIKFFYDWDWKGAGQKFKRAFALDPNYATAYQSYALYLAATGDLDEAKNEIQKARELDPQALPVQIIVGFFFHLEGQEEKAIEEYSKIIAKAPHFPLAHFYQGISKIHLSSYEEATESFKKALELSGGSLRMKAWLAYTYSLNGNKEKALQVIDEFQELSLSRYIDPSYIALINIGLGEINEAFKWLEKAYEDRSFLLIWLRVDPVFESLRSDSRFQDLLKRMKFDSPLN
jgi:TolB-like protein/Flp pilus assembly protein TadD